MLARLARWCHDRRRLVLALWIVGTFAAFGISGAVGADYRQEFRLPGSDSTAGLDILQERFGGRGAGISGTIVFRAEQGVTDPAVKESIEGLLATVAKADQVARVDSPYAPGGERFISARGPEAGKIAFATVEFPEDTDFVRTAELAKEIRAEADEIEGVQVELGGMVFAGFDQPQTEAFGLAFAIIILIVAFGSVLAMGLPVTVALFGIGVGSALVMLFSRVLQVPEFAPFLGLMIGLGVGIDYALLIVTRYREQLHLDHTVRESVEIALDTAGRSVVFAGATVVISLLGMLLMGVGFVQGLAVTAAATVAVTVLASVTLLPALLGFAGDRIERTRRRGLLAAVFVAIAMAGAGLQIPALFVAMPLAVLTLVAGSFVPFLKAEIRRRPPRPRSETPAYRWSRVIQHRPWLSALAAGLALLVLAVPVANMRLSFSDESNFPEESTTRKAYDLLAAGFGQGFNGPLFLVAELPSGFDLAELGPIGEAAGSDPGVAFISPPIPNDMAKPTAVLWNLVPTEGPQEEATTKLVKRLRSDVLPPVESAAGIDVRVTGFGAGNIDFSTLLSSRLPIFFGAVLALSFLLLMAVFRSLLVPLKAVLMNLLSIGAAFGVIVAIFQWGWLSDISGVSPAPIEPWAPMMLFAVVFGLSMDYEVFLLSRVREEWKRTGDSHTSVADGLAATAKVITAAAAIMVVVFGSFLLENNRTIKLMGTGLAVAILLDATIVRMVLVPATMELLGDRNWWLPGWLERRLPNFDVEGHAYEAERTRPVELAASADAVVTEEAPVVASTAPVVKRAAARKAPAKKTVAKKATRVGRAATPVRKAAATKAAAPAAAKKAAKNAAAKKAPAKRAANTAKAPAKRAATAKRTTRTS